MDVLTREAWPTKNRSSRGHSANPYVLKALAVVQRGEVARFYDHELKTIGYAKPVGLEQALRRQANKLGIKLTVNHILDKSTGERTIWVMDAKQLGQD